MAINPDDAPQRTGERRKIPERAIGGTMIRAATEVSRAERRGVRSPADAGGVVAKQQVTQRLDPDILARFRADGPGWQGRINEAQRKAVGL